MHLGMVRNERGKHAVFMHSHGKRRCRGSLDREIRYRDCQAQSDQEPIKIG